MDLGAAKLRLSGINHLLGAVHPQHGVIWTDSKGIFLAPVQLCREEVEKAGSLRLGEFESVQSVHWSCSVDSKTCYMAAVHQQNVTVWRVVGAVPRLNFKQVRKINVQVIPQGCLWNPVCDVLCLLSRQQCSFYFRHTQNRGSFAFPSLEKEKIMCGCWAQDGKRLVLGVGTALLIYTWKDLEGSIGEFVPAAWCIPGIFGTVTALSPASDSTFVCTSDQPLDRLCKNKDVDAFLLPANIKGEHGPLSIKDSLLNLQQNPKAQIQETAMLHVLRLQPDLTDPVVVAKAPITNLLSPDLLCFQTESQCVVVGSNTQSQFQVFALLDSYLVLAGHVSVGKDEKPKGVCNLPAAIASRAVGVLVLVGTTKPGDATFPSSSNMAQFTLSLRFFPTKPENIHQLSNGHAQNLRSQSSAALTKADSVRELKSKSTSESRLQARTSSYRGDRPSHRVKSLEHEQENSVEPMGIKMSLAWGDSPDGLRKLVEEVNTSDRLSPSHELETELTDFTHSSPQFLNAKLSQAFEMNTDVHSNSEPGLNKEKRIEKGPLASSSSRVADNRKTEQAAPHQTAKVVNGFVDAFTEDAKPTADCVHLCTDISSAHAPKIGFHNGGSASPRDAVSPVLPVHGRDVRGSPCSSLDSSSSSNYEMLERQIQQQKDHIDALQKKLGELSVMVQETACVFPTHYQSFAEPEFLHVQCVADGKQVSRRFLLDNGRLQLEPVKMAFGLVTVELVLDGEPLVLGANVDGYIPMRFSPGSSILITGVSASAHCHPSHKAEQ